MPRRRQECKDKVNFADCTVVQLKAELRQRGLRLGGRKADLLARLLEHERRNRRGNGGGRRQEEKKQHERKQPQRRRRRRQLPRTCFDVIMQDDEDIKEYLREDGENVVFIIGENAHCFNYNDIVRLTKTDIFECGKNRRSRRINPRESKRLFKVDIGGVPHFFKRAQFVKLLDATRNPGRSRAFRVTTGNTRRRVGTKEVMIGYTDDYGITLTYVREDKLVEIERYREGQHYSQRYGVIPMYSHEVVNIIEQVGGGAQHRCDNQHDPRAIAADTVRISTLRGLRSYIV